MKCDRRWWLDGRSALVDRALFPTQPGGELSRDLWRLELSKKARDFEAEVRPANG